MLLAAMGATAAAAPLLGLDPWSLVNIESGFALLTASSLAGGWAWPFGTAGACGAQKQCAVLCSHNHPLAGSVVLAVLHPGLQSWLQTYAFMLPPTPAGAGARMLPVLC